MKRSVPVVALLASAAAQAADPGFIQDFTNAGELGGFFSGATLSNSGSNGVGGAADGFLTLSRTSAGNFATANSDSEFTGNLTADGVTGFSLYLNDIGTDQAFDIHVAVGTSGSNLWLYTPSFLPGENQWTLHFVDLTNAANWTLVQGAGTFAAALAASNRLQIRQDALPFGSGGDSFVGDLGIDRIVVVPEPSSLLVLAPLLLVALKKRR